ncbi:MAG TPA: TadE/TadG family type IV pilus assembly protein [Candidatus Eisenbacteria bacterium]|nr:TadE/TadG family type IV pilus assembly protein [Candidatus Eisenbacteria bacterium]
MSLAFRNARKNSERGTALIEFTLVLPLLLLLTVAAVDFGRAFFVRSVLEQAAREGVRMRAVTTSADSALVRDRVLQVANSSGVTVSNLLIEALPSKQVHVQVTGDFNWIFPGMFNLFGANFTNPMPLTGDAWMRNEGTS